MEGNEREGELAHQWLGLSSCCATMPSHSEMKHPGRHAPSH